ncbi:MAG: thiamine pyrophosphate-dependent dehydrogenase E1 component subunit alpha [Armatimonadota bacterium]|nr:thiamine pyrophosphate-dependent dehydrogenase E1 component subunit alpha [Armatimonadota bacterium]MDR7448296.1 thiamine pyrophosphate-dependent dehydrogenase E1 component subunit alpha [Armatimonadota bacterium]MDR7458325.1 thiamine pyrophosphate-dependent dehydrogenase E1 component subunit alpha [Armatimonadota bacterium]MDR7478372.1 thiamine pyrophosphate-dependent dehydrogenase E1 component subunit alpha [Armatimonadota bacterium]MDR7487306.1 thiamine pyrophosphate-dependent dehydrogena
MVYTPDFLRRLYADMLLIRRFEERAAQLRLAGHIPGFLHPSIGQEAVAVGACAALEPQDYITSTHRGHGHILARGADPGRMYAELFARREGYNRGKGGSLHIASAALGIMGANGIVGGGIPIAVGLALALTVRARLAGTGAPTAGVAVAFFGDGASNQGVFHESLNLAALWRLPVVFICENNLYGEFTPQHRHQPIRDIAGRAVAYAMPGVVADGNDVLDVFRVVGKAVTDARQGRGPTLVECKTYRLRGHYEGDMGHYRPPDEVAAWQARDPVVTFRERLLAEAGFTTADLEEVERAVEARLEAGVRFALQAPRPAADEALEDVYVETHDGSALA